MTTWKCLMVKVKSRQFWDVCVAVRYQSLSLLLETKCFSALFLMHQFKGKASKQHTLQVRISGCGLLITSLSFFSGRYSSISFYRNRMISKITQCYKKPNETVGKIGDCRKHSLVFQKFLSLFLSPIFSFSPSCFLFQFSKEMIKRFLNTIW